MPTVHEPGRFSTAACRARRSATGKFSAPPDFRRKRDGFSRNSEIKMTKTLTEIRSLARSHTRTALNVLVDVMRNTKAPPPARIAAANAILDRGWGKATQAIETGDDGALELIHRIERVIVRPENPDR
jgi:hypothetical protein